MSETSLQVQTWIDKALHTDVWLGATQAADAAITACPDTPIWTAEDATARRESWEALGQAIGDTETAVQPLRSRIHELRTELAGRVNAVLHPAQARVDVVRRLLGAWDARERVRLEAAEAEQRKTAAYAHIIAEQDGDLGGPVQGLLDGGAVGDQAYQAAPQAEVDPFSVPPPVPSAGPTGATRKAWVVEILDADKLRSALLMLPAGDKLQAVLRVHEPTLRKMLANELGPDKAESAFPAGCVSVRSDDRAVRSRKS